MTRAEKSLLKRVEKSREKVEAGLWNVTLDASVAVLGFVRIAEKDLATQVREAIQSVKEKVAISELHFLIKNPRTDIRELADWTFRNEGFYLHFKLTKNAH